MPRRTRSDTEERGDNKEEPLPFASPSADAGTVAPPLRSAAAKNDASFERMSGEERDDASPPQTSLEGHSDGWMRTERSDRCWSSAQALHGQAQFPEICDDPTFGMSAEFRGSRPDNELRWKSGSVRAPVA